MMYSVFACWFIFQLLASQIVFIPVYHLLENRKFYVKIIATLILIGLGALFYHLNIQKLNGKYFPAVCKMFVFANIFGIAGLLMIIEIGKCQFGALIRKANSTITHINALKSWA